MILVRAARLFGREIDSLHTAAYILGASALTSSLLALFRDRLFAHTFGAGEVLDVYFAAFRVPDLIFVFVASLFSAYALIPILAGENREGKKRYIDSITLGFGVLILLITCIAYIAVPLVMPLLFPKFGIAATQDLILLSRILLLQPVFLGFSNILAAITQIHRHYILYALTPVVYNISIIAGLLLLYPLWGITGLAWGVVVGALLHASIQIPSVVRSGFFNRMPRLGRLPGRGASWETIQTVCNTVRLSFPRTITLGVGQLVNVVLVVIAGLLAPGSIAIFMFAFNLQAVPLAVIGASYSVAAFPTLSRMVSNGEMSAFVSQVVTASRHILFWSIPAIALMIVLRAHMVRVILGSGAFDWTDTRLTAAAFALFAIALAGSAMTLLIVRAYYAAGRSYTPLLVSVFSGIFAIGMGLILVFSRAEEAGLFLELLMRVENVPGTAVLLLPFAYAVSAVLGAIILVILFDRHFKGLMQGISRIFWESITAAGVGGILAYSVLAYLGGIGPATTLVAVLYHGGLAGLVGLLGIGMVYWFFGSPEFYEVVATLSRSPRNVTPVQSSEENIPHV
jgi:putative peptidoglycan lipid II flippase